MSNVISINTLDELRKFLDEKGIMEIALRDKNKKFNVFQKISIDKLTDGEAQTKLASAVNMLKQNNQIGVQTLNVLNGVAGLAKLNVVFSGLNLFATCAGFAIMYEKLDKMSSQIAEIVGVYKKAQGITANFEFDKVLSEHSNMLDCRKTGNDYIESEMRKLVDDEFNVLKLLINTFDANVTDNREDLLFSIISLSAMLATSVKYFDEVYFFNNKDNIVGSDKWHGSHKEWIAVFDRLSSEEFIKDIQDFGIFEVGLGTEDLDHFYIDYRNQIYGLKEEIEDNQKFIEAIGDLETYKKVKSLSNAQTQMEIAEAVEAVGLKAEDLMEQIQVAVA